MLNFSKTRRVTNKAFILSTAAWGVCSAAVPLLVGTALSAAPVAALAQNTANEEVKGQLPDVIVTARKRNESLLSVPIAVTAFTAQDIRAAGILSLEDITAYTPGFTLDNNGSDHPDRAIQNLFIRGMSSAVSPTVTVFIDGAPVPEGFVSEVSDSARVEVLKGPQSAFFGRETFGGAVNIVTKAPSNDYHASFDGLYGSDNWYDLKASVEGPLIEDKLTARVSVRDYSTDGQYKSTIAPYANLGAQSTKSLTVALNYTPVEALTVKLFGSVWEDRDGPAPALQLKLAAPNLATGAGPAGTDNFICGTLPNVGSTHLPIQTQIDTLFQNQVFNNPNHTLNPLFPDITTNPGFVRDAFHAHMNIDYKIPNWNMTLTSLTAGNIQKSEDLVDLDDQDTSGIFNFYTLYGIPNVENFYQWFSRVQANNSDFSQEFRVTSDQTARLRYTAGVSYERSTTQSYVDGLFPFGTASFGAGGPQVDSVEGVFGSISYDPIPKLTITLEGRYQRDAIAVYNRFIGSPNTPNAKTSSEDFLPRAIIQYKLTPTSMIYATYSKGVNPPVFNAALVGIPTQIAAEFASIYGVAVSVKPEYLENYEVGVKGQFLDRKLQLSADVYYDNWTNQILSEFVSVPGIPGYLNGAADAETVQANGGVTHLYGVETDGRFEVTPSLVVTFAGAYNGTDVAKYPNYYCPGDACTANGGATNIDGHDLPNAPKFSANLSATYTGQINATLGWYGRADYIYKGSQYTDLSNLTKIGDSNRFNFRVGLTRGTASIEAFVLNAFNDKAYPSVNGTTDIDGQPNAYGAYPLAEVLGVPVLRQFGVRLRKTF
jgi:iron complex outermembrane receptor protein